MGLIETAAGGWWLHSAAGGGLLLLAAAVLMALTRQPARRQRLGEWGAAAALLVAALSLAPAWLRVPVPEDYQPRSPAAPAVEEHPAPATPAAPPAPEAPAWAPDVVLADPGGATDLPAPEAPAPPAAAPPAPARAAETHFTLTTLCRWLGVAYAVVAAILVVRLLWHHLLLWRLLRSARPAPPHAARLFAELASGLTPAPRLLIADRLHVPVSCGLLRPTVLLPAALAEQAPETALRWVFAHELTHVRRRDAWARLLLGLAQAVYFYVPWFWPLRRQVRLCQEYLADAAAVAQGAWPEDYAEFLLRLVALPAAPAAATGVLGHSSDLFRRVTMLLKPSPLEKRCPRFWSLAVAAGLLSGAVLLSGVGLKAAPAPAAPAPKEEPKKDAPKKDEPKKEEPKKDEAPAFPGLPKIEELLPPDLPPEVAEQLKKQMKQLEEQMKRLQQQGGGIWVNPGMPGNPFGPGGGWGGGFGIPGLNAHGRLGAMVKKPDATLIEQLDLPKNQGIVIGEVKPDSAAAKAGLKANDILLELNGKPVSSDPREFVKMLDDIKANTPVDAVVMRKGKKETIKGLSLPEAPKPVNPFGPGGGAVFPGGLPGLPGGPGNGGFPGARLSVTRTDDNFRGTYTEGPVSITVTGKMDDGKAKVDEISVTDNDQTKTYKSVDQVPEDVREDVKTLLRKCEAGGLRVAPKKPQPID
jgi:beta-lactamase regulating signal transducer with metallopeptidase domain